MYKSIAAVWTSMMVSPHAHKDFFVFFYSFCLYFDFLILLEMIYSCAHLAIVLTNLLKTSLLVLCFPNDFFCFASKLCKDQLIICFFFAMNGLKVSSLFDVSIYLSIYLCQTKTSWCVCHISKQEIVFHWSGTYGSNWSDNSFLKWEKNRKIQKIIADHGSSS